MSSKEPPVLAPQLMIEAVRYCADAALPSDGMWTTFAKLCQQARVPLRATVPKRKILVYRGAKQWRAKSADAVGVPSVDLKSPEAALRALEALAHSFHDHAARHCICGRGYFRSYTSRVGQFSGIHTDEQYDIAERRLQEIHNAPADYDHSQEWAALFRLMDQYERARHSTAALDR